MEGGKHFNDKADVYKFGDRCFSRIAKEKTYIRLFILEENKDFILFPFNLLKNIFIKEATSSFGR